MATAIGLVDTPVVELFRCWRIFGSIMKGKRSADSDSNMCLNTCCWLTKSTHAFLKASASVEFAVARIGASLMGVLAK